MRATIIIFLAGWLMQLAMLHAGETLPRRPNILHIHADDHRTDGLRALGNPTLQTPNLDMLVAPEGRSTPGNLQENDRKIDYLHGAAKGKK